MIDMKELFKDILSLEGVKGIMLFSFAGELIFKEFSSPPSQDPEQKNWWGLFFNSLNGVREADLVFEKSRLYIRRTELGYLLVLTGVFAPIALMRLQTDMLLPQLKQIKTSKKFKRLLKNK